MKAKSTHKKFPVLVFAVRLILACAVITYTFVHIGPYYVQAVLPIIKKQIQWLHPDYDIHEMNYTTVGMSKEIAVTISIVRPFTDEFGETGNWRDVSYSIHASTLYSHPIIIFSLLLAWPGLTFRHRLKSILFSFVLLFVAISLDHPFHLISQSERGLVIDTLFGKIREFWVFMLTNGGRQFISVLFVLLAISYQYFRLPEISTLQEEKPVHRNAPCPCGS